MPERSGGSGLSESRLRDSKYDRNDADRLYCSERRLPAGLESGAGRQVGMGVVGWKVESAMKPRRRFARSAGGPVTSHGASPPFHDASTFDAE
jgi:hypothetical protein